MGLLFLCCSALAQQPGQDTPHPGRSKDVDSILVPAYYRNYNALVTRNEWAIGEEGLFTLGNSYTLIQPDFPLDNFTADIRRPQWEVTVGSQFLKGVLPIYDQFVMRGIRGGWQTGPWSAGVWAGTTQDFFEELRGARTRQNLMGATVGFTPTDFQSIGLTVMPYSSMAGGDIDRSLLLGQVYVADETEQGQKYGIQVGYGRDLGGAPAASPSSRQGLSLLADYQDDRLRLNLRTLSLGGDFGPPQGLFDMRGRHMSTLSGEYKVNDSLTFNEESSILEFGLGSVSPTRSATLFHSLRYQAKGYTLYGGWQQLSLLSPGQASYGDSWMVNALVQAGDWEIQPSLRLSQIGGQGAQELGIGVKLPLSPRLRLQVQEYYDNNQFGGSGYRTNLGLTYQIPDRGELSVGYLRQDSLAGSFFQGLRRDALVASGILKIRGDLQLSASLSQNFGQANLLWLPDDHNQVALEHRFQDPQNQFVYANFTAYPLGHYTTLTWTSSFGGPLENGFRQARLGSIRIQFRSHAPGDSEAVPVPDIRVVVDQQELRTNEQGDVVVAGVSPGLHTVKIPKQSLPAPYLLESQETHQVEVAAGEAVQLPVSATAYASVEVVVFNDTELSGEPPMEYLPLAGVAVLGPDGAERKTAADGRIVYAELAPGSYTIGLVGSQLPAGYETTTLEHAIQARSGQVKRVAFGLRGRGKMRLLASRMVAGSQHLTQPLAGLPLLLNGKLAGSSDPQGILEIQTWTGTYQIGLAPAWLNTSYLTGRPCVDVPLNGETEVNVVVMDYSTVQVKVVGEGSPEGVAVTLIDPSGAKQTAYLDASGEFLFDHLKIGNHTLRLEELTLPIGYQLQGAPEQVQDLRSGAHQTVIFRLRKLPKTRKGGS
ncbi:hypothetical protein IV102_26900 [bacterium]|nr:hypothetical protein [bacterium]